jgi:hypothetical protein
MRVGRLLLSARALVCQPKVRKENSSTEMLKKKELSKMSAEIKKMSQGNEW